VFVRRGGDLLPSITSKSLTKMDVEDVDVEDVDAGNARGVEKLEAKFNI